MPIRITAKKAGFRRCGVAHTATPTTYPDGEFTLEEIDALMDEPALVVEIFQPPDVKNGTKPEVRQTINATMTVKKLEEELTKMGVALPEKYTKADLVDLIVKNTIEPGAE